MIIVESNAMSHVGRTLAPDIVLRSPIIEAPFTGCATATELCSVLFESFGEFEVDDHLVDVKRMCSSGEEPSGATPSRASTAFATTTMPRSLRSPCTSAPWSVSGRSPVESTRCIGSGAVLHATADHGEGVDERLRIAAGERHAQR